MSRELIISLSLVVQALIAVARYVPGIGEWFAGLSTSAALGAQLSVIGVHFTLLMVSVGLLFLKEATDRASFEKALLGKIGGATVKPLPAAQFYSDFAAAMRSAKHNVNICYFATTAPDATYDPGRKEYYAALPSIVRDRPNVTFRRIIRKTPSNLAWLAEQMDEFRGVHNVALAHLIDAPEDETMGLALSAQVIDGEHVWLVAVESHDREGKYRDVYIHDAKLGEAFTKYFERLWRQSETVLQWGSVTPEGEGLLAEAGSPSSERE